MDKLRAFDFFTVVIPGMIFTGILIYIYHGDAFFIKDGPFLRLVLILLPLYLFLGHLISFLGNWLESIIDKLIKFIWKNTPEHPLAEIFPKYPHVLFEITKLFPECDETKMTKGVFFDTLFDKCRALVYQQSYGERPQSISTLATFYRNLTAVFLILIPSIGFCKYLVSTTNEVVINDYHFAILMVTLLLFAYFSRLISQKMYRNWFVEVLKNTEIYFKTKKINNK